ncbi:unnamed protein product, partial [Mesorhabditis belari]|uniref:Peptidase M24 domain-containing protein n=1 Tax=Mesorhabditis belari TaxID=2138241 RepID=A0AAF3FEK9_9BILA
MPGRKESETSSAGSETEEQAETIASDLVVTKYSAAAEIVNSVLKEVLANVKEGTEVAALCDLGDKLLKEKTDKVYKKEKNIQKGVAMPTCVSVDNCICHFSPLRSDPPVLLKTGNVVKVDLGAHIDGYVATAAHTVVVGASKDNKVDGKKADVIRAAYDAMEIGIRMLRQGTKNMDITEAIDKTASAYGVKPIENMISHSLERNKIDGEKMIIQNPDEKQRSAMEKCTIDKHEVYAIDVLFSTGPGKTKDMDARTTVFKREDTQYSLKMKASRVFFHDVVSKFGFMPFTLRAFEDEVKAKMGVVECERHGLLRPYQVLYEKEEEVVAQFKATVLVMPSGLLKIAGLPLDVESLNPTKKLEDEALLKTLNSSLKPKKKKPATSGTAKKEEAPVAGDETKQ